MKRALFFIMLCTPFLMASESLSGLVISQSQLKISSRHMGYIQKVDVDEGDSVDRGTLLYTIDSKEVDAMKEQLLLSLDQVILSKQMYQNQYAHADLQLQRHKRLFKKDMVAKVDVESLRLQTNDLKALMQISDKQVQQIKVRLKNVEHQYSYLNIVAPTNGVIIEKNIDQGDISIPGMPALIMADLEKLLIEAEVTESLISQLSIGMSLDVEIPSIKHRGKGKIKYIIPFSGTSAHRFKIKIAFEHQAIKVYPGMYVKISLMDEMR